MANKKADITKKAIEVTKKEKLFFIEDIVAHLPISKTTFYAWKLNESDELKELLEQNKVKTKIQLRKNWLGSSNATLNIALYKLLANEQERKVLSDRGEEAIEDLPEIKINVISNRATT